jgi:uncharacterized protein YyaL (SSP411 family)
MKDHPHTNALINETSPYLLQHAHNPVNWYPWGEEALQKAEEEGKLIIVSIGYSSCHWCHVMEHESFEDSVVAQLMNEHFISIKVDREERPDIDHIYMTAVQLLNQQGGWPLNCIALPDGRPIWGGTYFPKEQWMDVLQQVSAYYRDNPEKTLEYAAQLAEGIKQNSIYEVDVDPVSLDQDALHSVIQNWSRQFDQENGGNQGAPKFPMPVNLEALLHYGVQYKDQSILDHVDLTLTKMARGGIYDQVGGGFSRYSVDPIWKVPHFEKMLYDNAQLIGLYSRAYQVFGNDNYRHIVQQSIEFLKREMVSGQGAFFSALDADSEGEEGKYYIWGKDELEELLGGDFDLFSEYYNVNATGLWEDNSYILNRTSDPEEFAAERGLEYQSFLKRIARWNNLLLEARSKRIPPGLDDKSLTSWSSLMISGLAQAYRALGNPEYLELAITSAGLIRDELLAEGNLLYRNYKNGIHSIPGFHVDYALFIEACLDLYESSMDPQWLDLASELTRATAEKFYDEGSGMFQYNAEDSDILITNNVESQDNVIPSSNSIMAHNLFRLGHITAEKKHIDQSLNMLRQMAGRFEQHPQGFANWGRLLLKQQNPYYEIAVVGPSAATVIQELSKEYLPNAILVGSEAEGELPLFRDRFESGKTRIFVCQDNVCQLPVENPEDAKRIYHIK